MAPLALEPDVQNSHLYDMELCELLHSLEARNIPEVVKKTVRNAVGERIRKFGMKYDDESIRQYKISFHDHDPRVHLQPNFVPELSEDVVAMQQRLDRTAPKIKRAEQTRTGSISTGRHPLKLDANTVSDELLYKLDTDVVDSTTIRGSVGEDSIGGKEEYNGRKDHREVEITPTQGLANDYTEGAGGNSPGPMFLEGELYEIRVETGLGSAVGTCKAREVAREDGNSEAPEIPARQSSPPPPPVPQQTPPWQLVYQQLLNWAVLWPKSKLDAALKSTTSGHQADEISLSIWATQSYKRYVWSRMTDSPHGRVDRLFVPPNIANAISTAVFDGRRGDACLMLKDLWAPFGLDGTPRLLIVLARHRSDANHWVVHRFSLPNGQLTTYDTFPGKSSPDGKLLRWWSTIRTVWPDANNHNPGDLVQKIVRLHRPLQLGINNSVAAAGIGRNLLMGLRADHCFNLEALRDLINSEVGHLRRRKLADKPSVRRSKPKLDDMS